MPKRVLEKHTLFAWAIIIADVIFLALLAMLYILVRGSLVSFLNTLALGMLSVVGAIIIARQPGNIVGWIAILAGADSVVADLLAEYATFTLIVHPGALPFGVITSWLGSWSWSLSPFLAIPFMLLFPNGKLHSRRWRWVIIAAAFVNGAMMLGMMAATWPQRGKALLLYTNNNSTPAPWSLTIWHIESVLQSIWVLLAILAAAGLLQRFIHSRGVERQQLKWIVAACLTIPVSFAISVNPSPDPLLNIVLQSINIVSGLSLPVAFAIAVTRYKLYEIDVIIRRTLIYSALTFTLAAIYFASIVMLQEFFQVMTGQHQSPLSTVLSTLIIAVLFTPLRRRIQGNIDRRFYRRKYDTEKMLAQFAATQRETLELEQVNEHLLQIVEDTLQPEFVSLAFVRAPQTSRDTIR